MEIATALGAILEEEKQAEWGGWYSIYRADSASEPGSGPRADFVKRAAEIGAVELELAATAAFLFREEHVPDPWSETARRKPQKAANGRLQRAKLEYAKLRAETRGHHLPELPQA
jgi:hypothetical protein